MLELNAVSPESTTLEYYGWTWLGVQIVRLYFKRCTLETVSVTLFGRFSIGRTWTHLNVES